MGKDVDNFWQREVSDRFKARDPEALEMVLHLLGQVMMRHSKAQTLADSTGVHKSIVTLPPKRTEEVLLTMADGPERAVYCAFEAFCQHEFRSLTAVSSPMQHYLSLLSLATTLQGCATHPALLKLDVLHDRLQRAVDAATARRNTGGLSHLDAPPRKLREILREIDANERGRQKIVDLLADVSAQKCVTCWTDMTQISEPVLVKCCLQVFCRACATRGLDTRSRFSFVSCGCCGAKVTGDSLTPLLTPLDATDDRSAMRPDAPPVPAADAAARYLQQPPPPRTLAALRVWQCSGSPCADGGISRRKCKYKVDGDNYFCSKTCLSHRLHADCGKHASVVHTGPVRVSSKWKGSLSGRRFSSFTEAMQAAAELTSEVDDNGNQWEGVPLYPRSKAVAVRLRCDLAGKVSLRAKPVQWMSRTDDLYPLLTNFPPLGDVPTPPSRFLAHYDAAGGARPYGVHPPCVLSTKLAAVIAAVDELPKRGKKGGSKAVIFSASASALSLLHDELCRRHGAASTALVNGTCSSATRSLELLRFSSEHACFVLLLSVGACAAGLTLTAADHCFLLELQSHAGKELQLVNRIYRIGQQRAVVVKKFVMSNTIEQRMSERRKLGAGLMATDANANAENDNDHDEDADAMAVCAVGDEVDDGDKPGKATASKANSGATDGDAGGAPSAAVEAEKLRHLRCLFGLQPLQ